MSIIAYGVRVDGSADTRDSPVVAAEDRGNGDRPRQRRGDAVTTQTAR